MSVDRGRREFLKSLGAAGTMLAAAATGAGAARRSNPGAESGDELGVLTDLTQCIGCRKCEWACREADLRRTDSPASGGQRSLPYENFEDRTILGTPRRPDARHLTVVNRFDASESGSRPVFVKVQCMHCNDPACVSACIVSAFRKEANGAVIYDPWRCMGCRYCMVACPFQIPAYEFDEPLAPAVRKCSLCFDRISKAGGVPACVEICPPQCLTFGKRSDLVALAHRKLEGHPEKYHPHVYGEHEAGGTSWLYVADRPFERLGFPALPDRAPPRLTEAIQHGVFKHFIPPLALYALLGGAAWLFRDGHREARSRQADEEAAAPAPKKMLTAGVWTLLAVAAFGAIFGAIRFLRGLGAATNLNDQYPWGLWIAFDVATGVALAAGGFTTAALVHIFHQRRYHALVRPALLSAMLGYTFVVLGLLADLGRYYNVWHPLLPAMWSGRSVLFEVGMCVMTYLTVLYFEFVPVVTERFKDRVHLPGILARLDGVTARFLRGLDRSFHRVMFLLIIAGVVLSCLHQSSLGSLMLIAPGKMDPLWYTPILPLLFLLSAMSVGYPMVVFESLFSAKVFGRRPEMDLLAPLSRFTAVLLGLYLAVKLGDLAIRERIGLAFEPNGRSALFLAEVIGGVALPLVLLLSAGTRRSPRRLFLAALLVISGVVLNRVNVFITAYSPLYATHRYVPSLGEFAVSAGLVATLLVVYRVMVSVFPVLPVPDEGRR